MALPNAALRATLSCGTVISLGVGHPLFSNAACCFSHTLISHPTANCQLTCATKAAWSKLCTMPDWSVGVVEYWNNDRPTLQCSSPSPLRLTTAMQVC